MGFDLREHSFRKLYHPKIVNVFVPGEILHKNPGLFGSGPIITRSNYSFELFFSNLYKDSNSVLNKKELSDLWYRIGKDMVKKYLAFYSKMKINQSNIVEVLKYFSDHFCAVGMSVFENVFCDFEKEEFTFSGENSIVCRGSFDGSYLAGIASGLISFLLGKNIEANFLCNNCPKSCKIIVRNDFTFRYESKESLDLEQFYSEISFGDNEEKVASFYDFLNFKFVLIDNYKKFSFEDFSLFPSEIGLLNIFFYNYSKMGLEGLYFNSFRKTSEIILDKILNESLSISQKITKIRNMSSAFGWGKVKFSKIDKHVTVNFFKSAFVFYNVEFIKIFFNVVLNKIYSLDFHFQSLDFSKDFGKQDFLFHY